MITAYIGVGSNIEREHNARLAVQALSEIGNNLAISSVYDCASVDFDSHPFFNFVVRLDTDMTLAQFSEVLRAVEIRAGREKDAQKYQDRALDLDILLFGDVVSTKNPQLPRDDIYKYPFVIQPLYELCPELKLPGDGRTVGEIWQSAGDFESLTKVTLFFEGF